MFRRLGPATDILNDLALVESIFRERFRIKKEDIILVKDPYTFDDLNKLKSNFNSGSSKARDTLIEIYKDKNQILLVSTRNSFNIKDEPDKKNIVSIEA